MKKKKLAVIVPTANREKAIEYWLSETVCDAQENNVDLIVYDSSNSDKTKEITEKYVAAGGNCVRYCRYTGLFDGVSLDHKIISAYEEFAEDYEYIWLIRDGLIPQIDLFFEKLNLYMEKSYECIIVDALYRNNYIEKEIIYSHEKRDCVRLLQEQAHRLQTLGMLIFSSKFAMDLIKKIPIDETNYSLWQMAAPLHYFAKYSCDIIFYVGDTFTFNENCFKGHFWGNGAKMFEQWGCRWCNVIEKLPSDYDEAKNKVMKIYTFDFHPFSPKAVVELRAYGGLDKKMVNKYQKYIEKTSNTPIWFFFFVASVPKIFWKLVLLNKRSLFVQMLCCLYVKKTVDNIEKDPLECVEKLLII